MASASTKLVGVAALLRIATPIALASVVYAASRVNWPSAMEAFFTGPGRTSRILLLVFLIFNWKTVVFAWTYRVFYAIFFHNIFRKSPQLTPEALFKPMISETHAPLMEIDYNLHKSNSTYFSDLDVSRTHLMAYLCRPSLRRLADNSKTRVVLDPGTGEPFPGTFGIILGAVGCSFKREISIYKGYEMWSRVLGWDRKWMYIVTHFVPKGVACPTHWIDMQFARKAKTRKSADAAQDWERHIYATAVSKYVFKLGRYTVHPAIVLTESGLLPPRPGGWTGGANQMGDDPVDLSAVDLAQDGEWDWRRIEAQRRKGMEMASQFQVLDNMHALFDGGDDGALANFGPG